MTATAHRRRRPLALIAGSLFALVWTANYTPMPRLVYNASDSLPIGWYHIEATRSLRPGDTVLINLPHEARTFAAQRGYLPANVPLLKTVAAIAPQHVCVLSGLIVIDGEPVAIRLRVDREGRVLPQWSGCRQLDDGELFLLSTANPESFDSRYFGPVPVNSVIGRAQPLWVESRP